MHPYLSAALGGILIGLASWLLLAAPGRVAGISGIPCSALRRAYREQLRAAAPGLRFVFLDITPEQARQRVATRSSHFFNTALVDSQFATLESPLGEAGVLRVDAALFAQWLPAPELPARAPLLIVAAGLLVGFGSVRGSGCTSGHGVCGLGRRSLRSLVAVLAFLASALVPGFLTGALH